ncbi:hypothetical protein BpHYR1_037831 [Brachionus plicatilis]|uniref:Uncharacterized protein n=1 Tax=Brachionus plicatilis TaxID=10195 RepID=A0A3M7QYN3_BRAPC|nr:hypothetical protein BpHYR1_037831 [Brachionus plicatilis]
MAKDASIPDKLPSNNPPLEVIMTANLRFHWLSPNFDHIYCTICNENYNFENFTQVTNGVIKVTIKYDLIDHDDFIDIVGTHNIESQRCLVQLAGYYKR